ncbi:hypothetical protein niasHS_004448 [Heterodera schachtii]|uniref:Uncharacterized protein n=1 Tax=Heterodera schachtii TaxID=97005 RepID=A0ABD2JR08_HETSC
MHQSLPLFLPLFIFFVYTTDCLNGLNCQQGAEIKPNGQKFNNTDQKCPQKDAKYCVTSICTTDEIPNYTNIAWFCDVIKNSEKCADRRKEKFTGLKNISCKCLYGEEGEENGNAQFTPPPPVDPNEKAPTCKIGIIDEQRRGKVTKSFCPRGQHHCFAASCVKEADGQMMFVVWGCVKGYGGNVCAEVQANATRALNTKLSCKCLFGDRDVHMTNEQMMMHHLFPPSATASNKSVAATTTTQTTMKMTKTGTGNTGAESVSVRSTIGKLSSVVLLTFAMVVAQRFEL